MTRYRMTTPWGKRRGWEIQRLRLQGRVFYRMTGRAWCYEATRYELDLWRAAKLPFGRSTP